MTKVILKKEPRYVSGRMVKPGERCTLPEHLARALETRGLCVVMRPSEEIKAEQPPAPAAEVEIKAEKPEPKKPVVKKKAAKKKEQ